MEETTVISKKIIVPQVERQGLVETRDRKNTGGRMGDGKKDARTREVPVEKG